MRTGAPPEMLISGWMEGGPAGPHLNPEHATMQPSAIVYVEDREDDFFFLKHALAQIHFSGPLFRIADAKTATELFLKAGREGVRPRLLIVDIQLGAASGKDLIHFVRSFPAFATLPIVALSDWFILEEPGAGTEADLFILKPKSLPEWKDLAVRLTEFTAARPSPISVPG